MFEPVLEHTVFILFICLLAMRHVFLCEFVVIRATLKSGSVTLCLVYDAQLFSVTIYLVCFGQSVEI